MNSENNIFSWKWFLTHKIDFESQILALFDTSPYTNSQNPIVSFLPNLGMLILKQKTFNFGPPTPIWKLDNPYYHSLYFTGDVNPLNTAIVHSILPFVIQPSEE